MSGRMNDLIDGRCGWCGTDTLYIDYHDREWGRPVLDDRTLFEFLVLESAQAGLSWLTVLRKREGYRRAFHDFDVGRVASMTDADVERLMQFDGIVRNRLKIKSAITNARLFAAVQAEFGSFLDSIRSFFPDGAPVVHEYSRLEELPVASAESDAMSRDMKKRGFKFFGTTICYAYLQATGFVDDHLATCRCRAAVGDRLTVDDELHRYVESVIIPRYSAFDKAHREEHVRWVIEQSLELASHYPSVDMDMVYIIAAFHDLGLVNGRENHHRDSRTILESDDFLKSRFSSWQIRVMGCAVEDHRASGKEKPRSIYGMIVADADRMIDPETIVRRTVQYGLANYPDLDRDAHCRRVAEHLENKYGLSGYLKIWLPWGRNVERLGELHAMMSDKEKIDAFIYGIFDEENACR